MIARLESLTGAGFAGTSTPLPVLFGCGKELFCLLLDVDLYYLIKEIYSFLLIKPSQKKGSQSTRGWQLQNSSDKKLIGRKARKSKQEINEKGGKFTVDDNIPGLTPEFQPGPRMCGWICGWVCINGVIAGCLDIIIAPFTPTCMPMFNPLVI